ncbi:hypothetical protein Pla52o_57210 [Novipirellula galeiformis]|uniref:Uncharacterized protein n=1 Tax=Novipirellula galeiformis TaxID=2528004 RepID=A0A5C6BFD9_9BACT|nr:hypothetical protein Pla52o_57210 [Novipirellula galeiformis]
MRAERLGSASSERGRRCKEPTLPPLRCIPGFSLYFRVVLVLSIAVLVLVLDCRFRYRIGPSNQPRQHRNDAIERAFQFGLPIFVKTAGR